MKAVFRADLFVHVVDSSGAAQMLGSALRTDRRGRPQTTSPRTFLILLLLAAADGELTIERMHHIATRELPRDQQLALGTVRPIGDHLVDMPIAELYYISRTITKKLSWTGQHAANLTEQQKTDRQHAVNDIVDRLVQATLPPRPGTSYALDESAIWAWAKGRKTRTTTGPGREPVAGPTSTKAGAAPVDVHLGEDPDASAAAGVDAEVRAGRARGLSVCPDATWGLKTGKNGQRDAYFGYGLHALVRVPDLRPGPAFTDEDDPILVEAIAVTPASTELVDVSLGLIDRVRARRGVLDLAADRHYSYKEWSRWAHELWARGVHPVLDLRDDEHGFRDYNGAKIAASWPHCPATPNRLGTIPRPGPAASPADKAAFTDKIEQRQAYAMRRVKSHVPDGASRWECPARAGKLGCPLVEGSVDVARQLELPVVAKPPTGDRKPVCCTQRTFMIRVEPATDSDTTKERDTKKKLGQAMKHAQDEYWGDTRWTVSYNRRTHVEGAFGNLKNANTENVRRGLFRFTGLPLVTLAIAAAVTAANVRQLRNWNDRTGNGDPHNPLLAPTPAFHGFVLLEDPAAAATGDQPAVPHAA